MTENNDAIVEKVRKLMEKAQNVAGTPEADVFNAKAFELIAKYGLDEDSVRGQSIDRNIDDSKLIVVTFKFGRFAVQRIELLWAIAQPLHCSAIVLIGNEVKLFGVARHIRRVKLLHGFLAAQMLAGASKARPNGQGLDRSGRLSIDSHRESWMKGFADSICAKIGEIEQAAIRQRDRNAGDTRMAVARRSDRDRAREAMNKQYPPQFSGQFKGTDRGSGYSAGAQAGSQTDVGQTRVGAGGRRQIG